MVQTPIPARLTWADLKAWSDLTGIRPTPLEWRLLRDLETLQLSEA
jgi:hypothetical protein